MESSQIDADSRHWPCGIKSLINSQSWTDRRGSGSSSQSAHEEFPNLPLIWVSPLMTRPMVALLVTPHRFRKPTHPSTSVVGKRCRPQKEGGYVSKADHLPGRALGSAENLRTSPCSLVSVKLSSKSTNTLTVVG